MRNLLHLFPKPSHYAGIEEGIPVKGNTTLRIALAFPDLYEIGMSYTGHKIIYEIINSNPDWSAERVMAPDTETGKILLEHETPLATLETDTPLEQLDAIGFAITHELCFTDVLRMLDLANIPLYARDRPDNLEDCPVIMAGGGALIGQEAISPFLDLIMLGDGEALICDVLKSLENAKKQKLTRKQFLREAAKIPGAYIPSLFIQNEDGTLSSLIPGYRPARRIVADLDKSHFPVSQICPVGAVHNRLTLEIARGCTRGCRFCHAGMVYRPVRERNISTLSGLLDASLDATGYEEVSFLSLSAGDYSQLSSLWDNIYNRCSTDQIALSLPSLRVGSVDNDIMEKISRLRRTGCTLAPEAGSQRLRDVINKGITEEELLEHARKLIAHGWRQVKLYFMIGLPTETDDDLWAILDLCRKTRDAANKKSDRLAITASVSPFVPKPFTPFQWDEQISLEQMRYRIDFLRSIFAGEKLLTLRWHDPEASHLEGILSRGDRRLAKVVEKAYHKGAIFSSWAEHFTLTPWLDALAECNLQAEDFIRRREPDAPLPWNHIEAGIDKEFLIKEREKAYSAIPTPDCRTAGCHHCGACDIGNSRSKLARAENIAYKPRFAQKNIIKTENLPLRPRQGALSNPLLSQQQAHYRVWHFRLSNYAYLSQLELQTIISRVIRRAKLPMAFSQGFHPLPLLSFGRALSCGVESEVEWFGLTFHSYMAPQKIMEKVNQFLPQELRVHKIVQIEKKQKTQQAIAEKFIISFNTLAEADSAAEGYNLFMEKPEYIYKKITKKGEKLQDIRPLLLNWEQTGNQICFTGNWLYDYLSPLLLTRFILQGNHMGECELAPYKIRKIEQIFEDGKIVKIE